MCGMCVCVCIVPTWGKSQNVKPKFQKSLPIINFRLSTRDAW